jgi:hypothetical protein
MHIAVINAQLYIVNHQVRRLIKSHSSQECVGTQRVRTP